MPDTPTNRTPWFHLITDTVLGRSGPGRAAPPGFDALVGEPVPSVLDNRSETQDVYGAAERARTGLKG